jgi:hypothetical protein
MRKLEFKEFTSNQELTKFVNDELIEPEDIVSINSVAYPREHSQPILVISNPFRYHLFYWTYEKIEENNNMEDLSTIFPKREY